MSEHLAQLNIGRLMYPADDPRVADFMSNLDRVNAIADRSPGFVWRLKDDSGNATSIRPLDAPTTIVNLSVWESVEALEKFVWQTVHKRFYGRRTEWFEKHERPHFAMWWVPEELMPTVAEAMDRLDHLTRHGPTAHAFGWESLPQARLWKQAQCA